MSKLFKISDLRSLLTIPAIISLPILLCAIRDLLNGQVPLDKRSDGLRISAAFFCLAGLVYFAVVLLRALDIVAGSRAPRAEKRSEVGMTDEAPKKRRAFIDNCALVAFLVGACISEWAAGLANRSHQAAYWPGIAVGLPLAIGGAALMIWNGRRAGD